MAFTLLPNNLTQTSVIDRPAGVIAGPDNFINLYTVADKYEKALIPQLHMAHGRGKVLQFCKIIGAESTYASDAIQHAEEGRLQTVAKNVTFAGSTFTSPTNHNLAVGDIVKISDGDAEVQATVTAITSPLIFVASNDAGGTFASLTGPVTVLCDFSNSYEKGSDDAVIGKRWNPDVWENFTHILKQVYNVSGSDMVHESWIQTPDGPRWYNHEVENSNILFDNKEEYTQIFFQRKSAGNARGVKGMLQQVEERGNIANEYITSIEELSDIAFRFKQQGTCREFHVWHNHQQGAEFRKMLAGVNAHYASGGNYGLFNNNKDTAMMLGFSSCYIDGVTFHFTPWSLLDDPTMFGSSDFRTSSLACMFIPSGEKQVTESGNNVSRPYFSVRYRSDAMNSRKREIKLFGPNGTAHKKDIQTTHFMSEFTNQLIGANEYMAVRVGAGFYS
jgi:hypothetical protein